MTFALETTGNTTNQINLPQVHFSAIDGPLRLKGWKAYMW